MYSIPESRTKNLYNYVLNSFKYLLYPYFQFYRLSLNDLKELALIKKRRNQKKASNTFLPESRIIRDEH